MKRFYFALLVAMMFVTNVTAFAAEEVAVAAGAGWAPLIAKVGALAIEVLAPVLMLLGSYAAYRLAKKFGVELGEKERTMVKGYVKQAINATEKWAKNQADKPTSNDKLAKAVDLASEFIKSSGLKAKSSAYLVGLIEAQLEWDENKDK